MSEQGTPAPGAETPAPVAAPADWTAALPEEVKGYVQNKGFRTPADVVESYKNIEKLMGAPRERLLTLPEKPDAPEWGAVYDRLGRPKEAKEYNLPLPEGADPKFAEAAKAKFHELGLGRTQAEKLAAWWNEHNASVTKEMGLAEQAKEVEAKQTLQREWGGDFEKNLDAMERVAAALELKDEHLKGLRSALGPLEATKLLYSIGAKSGIGKEDTFVSGDGKSGASGGRMTREAALAQIQALGQDAGFVQRYMVGGAEEKAKMDQLHQIAYSE